ncbi:MAG: DUF1232 domain-containing protein [Prevotellaceae bacterium]|nr:DUF1232 domain-containing protein [Prevotellaceae bacterium]
MLKLDYNALWNGICNWSRKCGRAATRPVLLLWYVMRSAETPRQDKLAIFASLAYLVFPIDILDAKRLPIIGWLDEIVSVAVMIQKMTKYITPEIQSKVDCLLDKWFPEHTAYELIEHEFNIRTMQSSDFYQ